MTEQSLLDQREGGKRVRERGFEETSRERCGAYKAKRKGKGGDRTDRIVSLAFQIVPLDAVGWTGSNGPDLFCEK